MQVFSVWSRLVHEVRCQRGHTCLRKAQNRSMQTQTFSTFTSKNALVYIFESFKRKKSLNKEKKKEKKRYFDRDRK